MTSGARYVVLNLHYTFYNLIAIYFLIDTNGKVWFRLEPLYGHLGAAMLSVHIIAFGFNHYHGEK